MAGALFAAHRNSGCDTAVAAGVNAAVPPPWASAHESGSLCGCAAISVHASAPGVALICRCWHAAAGGGGSGDPWPAAHAIFSDASVAPVRPIAACPASLMSVPWTRVHPSTNTTAVFVFSRSLFCSSHCRWIDSFEGAPSRHFIKLFGPGSLHDHSDPQDSAVKIIYGRSGGAC